MSHQIIITFDLDETQVQENAEKEAGRQVAREVMDTCFGASYNRAGAVQRYVEKAIREILEPEKEKIISEAVRQVAENLHRTKAVKELVEKMKTTEC